MIICRSCLTRCSWLRSSVSVAAFAVLLIALATKVPQVVTADDAADARTSDPRLQAPGDLDGYFPFTPAASPQEWETRKTALRRQMLLACGLWPMPSRPAITATVHGKVERDDYSVERVFFESSPGLYVTGSLYRPHANTAVAAIKDGKRPAILCPHGHWNNGRFHDHGEAGIMRELENGAEKFYSGRHPLQARCVQLARMGCIVFHYDMLGYADSVPVTYQMAHRFAKQRPHLNRPGRWGLFSPQAESRLVNIMGLQTWNSLRAVDWISQLTDVDTNRLGVTGASGGGTQSFMLAALDERIDAAFPAVMVSTAMQGGCTCENACYLRTGTGNVEMAALVAPRPLGLSAADDWTKELETKGLPELKQHYKMLGVANRIEGRYFPFKHNFNAVSRAMMFRFFNRHFDLQVTNVGERDYEPLTQAEMTVWNDEHAKPSSTEDDEVRAIAAFYKQARQPLAKLEGFSSRQEFDAWRNTVQTALGTMLCRSLPVAEELEFETLDETDRESFIEYRGLLHHTKDGDRLPTVFLLPAKWNRDVVVLVSEAGKSTYFLDDGSPTAELAGYLKAGYAVATFDMLHQGELTADGKTLTAWPKVKNPREFAGFTLGYNCPVFADRVHDVLKMVTFCKHHKSNPDHVHLVSVDGAGLVATVAGTLAGKNTDTLAVDTLGERFDDLDNIRDINLWPGAVKYGDVPAFLALNAPRPLWLAGEDGEVSKLAQRAFTTLNAAAKIITPNADSVKNATQRHAAVRSWLQSQAH